MTDATAAAAAPRARPQARCWRRTPRTKRRNAAETRFRAYGMAAIGIGLLLLVVLLTTIVSQRHCRRFSRPSSRLQVELPAGEARQDRQPRPRGDEEGLDLRLCAADRQPRLSAMVAELGIETPLGRQGDDRHSGQGRRGAVRDCGAGQPRR